MTRIDFHSNVADKISYTCRLIRKAHAANCKVVVFDDDQVQLSKLDEALWNFSESDFLPHVMSGDSLERQTAIILTADANAEFPHHELLINLTQSIPQNFERFARLIEIISSEQQDTISGRERYRNYQQQGMTPSVAKST
ncbi:DNA polymerase III subunit chi [Undibacterium sp.]|uniref:DNA polymerase III subunit chi n=1 Tax=Undibacterium sp. TaxID=1914977 RepID=UPI0025DDA4BE|nr:DNA polymerase III subunit chi [Undibacterium sp.]